MTSQVFRVLRVGGDSREIYIECERRRDNALFSFIAFGIRAQALLGYLIPGNYYTIDYDVTTFYHYDGEAISANFVQ